MQLKIVDCPFSFSNNLLALTCILEVADCHLKECREGRPKKQNRTWDRPTSSFQGTEPMLSHILSNPSAGLPTFLAVQVGSLQLLRW